MLVISNHVQTVGLPIPDDAVIRINVAWIKDRESLQQIIDDATHRIYLDYPTGRTKPPRPSITLGEAIDIANDNVNKVRCFAFSNAEDADAIGRLRSKVHDSIQLVPKIETVTGVENIDAVIAAAQASTVMLDGEDLYTDVQQDSDRYVALKQQVRRDCSAAGVRVLELKGVIFHGEGPKED